MMKSNSEQHHQMLQKSIEIWQENCMYFWSRQIFNKTNNTQAWVSVNWSTLKTVTNEFVESFWEKLELLPHSYSNAASFIVQELQVHFTTRGVVDPCVLSVKLT